MIIINGKRYNVVEASFGESGSITVEGRYDDISRLLAYLHSVINVAIAPDYAVSYFVYDTETQKIHGDYYRVTLHLIRM